MSDVVLKAGVSAAETNLSPREAQMAVRKYCVSKKEMNPRQKVKKKKEKCRGI
jgi:hypothetical protein